MDYTQQAQDFLTKHNATLEAKFSHCGPYFEGEKDSRDIYDITLKRNGHTYSFKFGQSLARTGRMSDYIKGTKGQKRIAPTEYDVLACLTKYEPESDTWEFAREFGYEINSRKDFNLVEKTCMAVIDEYKAVMRLFGDVIDQLREIE